MVSRLRTRGSSTARGCSKAGCLGCGSVFIAVAGLFASLLWAGRLLSSSSPQPRSYRRSRPLPFYEDDAPEAVELGDLGAPLAAGGTVDLDLALGELSIVAGTGDAIHLEADFDEARYELVEEYLPEEGGVWRYRLALESRSGWVWRLWNRSGKTPRVRLTLPKGCSLALEGSVGPGNSELRLGGLWLTAVDLGFGSGDHRISFDEPTRQAAIPISLKGAAGRFEVRGLGNASPSRAFVESAAGEMDVDLEGEWRQDGEVEVRFGVGSCRLRLPSRARVDVRRVSVKLGEKRIGSQRHEEHLPEDAPVVTLDVEGSLGELRVAR